jgi:alpha-1,3-glucosyltransferase
MKEKGKGWNVLDRWQWNTIVLSTLLKLSLVPTYHSTDFEVHRHWLAITNSLPLSQWYFDETSQWTLDYPPFFGYFSWLLSVPARLWDPKIVDRKGGLEYASFSCVLYMRVTVIATEMVLACALFALNRQRNHQQALDKIPDVVAAAILLHPGLLIVDHIHFQYNGFLFGILLWSIWAAREVRNNSWNIIAELLTSFCACRGALCSVHSCSPVC